MKKADKFDPAKWLVENKITTQSRLNEIESIPDTDYEDSWEKGGGPDEEEIRTATLKVIKTIPLPKGKEYKKYVLIDDEDGEEYSEYELVDSMEDANNIIKSGKTVENVYKVKDENGEDKIAVTYPYTKSKSEFAGKFN